MKHLNQELLKNNIDKAAMYDLDNNKVFGSAYLVYQKNSLVFKKCYGTISPTSSQEVTDTTLFRLASMTKPITTIAVLILVDRGLLSLDDTIDKFLPKFKNIHVIDSNGNNTLANKIPTIRNLLSHTSGIGCDPNKLGAMNDNDKKDLDSSIDFYLRNGLDFEPETTQQYSATGSFDVLTKIIEIISKTDYLSFLKKEIFTPCNMVDTTFEPSNLQYERLISMHNRIENKNTTFSMPNGCIFENFPSSHYLGGAGLVSTLRDYSNFAMMLLNKGCINGKELIKEETFNQMCTPQVSKDLMIYDYSWGLGVRVIFNDTNPYLPIGCFGWSGAYGAHFWIDPKNELFAVLMKNSKIDGGAGNESAENFEKAVYSSFETK